jgi:integrase
MSLYRRGRTWWVDLTTPNGRRIRRSARTRDRRQAQEYHDRLKADSWRQAQLGARPSRTWDEAVIAYLEHRPPDAPTAKNEDGYVRWLNGHLGGLPLESVTPDTLARVTAAKRAHAAPATVNRYLEFIRAVLRAAWRRGWIDGPPHVAMLREPDRRVSWLTREQADKLLALLPPHLADMARFTLHTGLREANVRLLTWSQVDMARRVAWVHPDEAKAGEAIGVPLNREALAVLSRRRGQHPRWVFPYKGAPLTRCSSTAWRTARAKAGLPHFRWHDLRHTAASWAVQAGTPLPVLQEWFGWRSAQMVRRYAHLAPEHIAPYADRLAAPPAEAAEAV